MLAVNNLAKSFANQSIFKDISFVISRGERVGLIGPNGSGKTTLLRIIADEEQPDRGSVFIDPHTRLGYLRQGLVYQTLPQVTQARMRIDKDAPPIGLFLIRDDTQQRRLAAAVWSDQPHALAATDHK